MNQRSPARWRPSRRAQAQAQVLDSGLGYRGGSSAPTQTPRTAGQDGHPPQGLPLPPAARPAPPSRVPSGSSHRVKRRIGPLNWAPGVLTASQKPCGKTPERGPTPERSPAIPVRGVICSPRKKGGDIPPSPAANPLDLERDRRRLGLGSHVSTRSESVPRLPAVTTVPPRGLCWQAGPRVDVEGPWPSARQAPWQAQEAAPHPLHWEAEMAGRRPPQERGQHSPGGGQRQQGGTRKEATR